MDDLSITKKGNPLDKSQYIIDLDKQLFATKQAYVSIDCNLNGWTFKTGGNCIFNTGHHCTFETGEHCTFKTGANCTFNTGGSCTFNTDWNCTFHTYHTCTFETGGGCSFSLYDIDSCKFKNYDGHSTIFDRIDNKRYVLSAELIKMLKIKNG